MSDLEKDIEAVKFLLGSFFGDPSEVDRQALIRAEAAENKYVKTYADFSKEELKGQLRILQAQSAGSFFNF